MDCSCAEKQDLRSAHAQGFLSTDTIALLGFAIKNRVRAK
jgi:hypothetical protein